MKYPYLKYLKRTVGIACVMLCFLIRLQAQTIIPNSSTQPGAGTKTINLLPAAYNSSITTNYVRVWAAEKPYTNDTSLNGPARTVQEVKQSTQYFDGLGRPLQTVAKGISPNGFDMVSPVVYDAFGREIFKYMPFVSTGNNGDFKTDPFAEQDNFMKGMYNPGNDANGEKYFYSQTDYEPSPLNRATKAYAPGNNWAGGGVGTGMQYLVNDVLDSVRIWNITFTVGAMPTSTASYGTGLLYETVNTDEQGNKAVEYKDKEGHVILKKVQLWSSPAAGHSGWLCTYYVYDDLGNLRYVIPPKATDLLKSNSWNFSAAPVLGMGKELCFNYEYDSRQRMIIKRVPGVGEVWLVYDARDRMVMTQDSSLRAQGKWLYTDYDSLNRPVLSGLWTNGNNRIYHQNLAGTSITYPTAASGYTILTQSYYDDYSWVSSSGSGLISTANTTYNSNTAYFYTADNNNFPYPQAIIATNLTRGMPTGTKVNVVGSTSYLYAVSFYDDRGRVVQTQSTNNKSGKDTVIMQYSFSGQAIRTLACHGKGGANAQSYKVLNKMTYDAAGRVTQVNKKIGNSPEVIIVKNQYDELGQLKKKDIGQVRNSSNQNTYTTNPIDSLRYNYNVRGWLRGINKDYARGEKSAVNWFGMELCYDFGFNATQLNGNIAGIRWKNGGDGEQRAYGFGYDAVNRILKADFTQYTSAAWTTSAGIDYSLRSMSYDQNGNILTMNQMGLKLNTSSLIDSLVYGYNSNSNKLNYVTDKQNDANSVLSDFKEINNNTTQDYWYDGNGNLTKDNNKNISSITYNYLNLPSLITVTGKGTITYTYDATGNKLKKVTVDNTVTPAKTTTTDYMGLFTYQNDTLQFVAQEEGRARPAKRIGYSDTMYYDYFEKDHLGNVRVVLTDELQTDAYPVASMEATPLATEKLYYDSLDNGRVNKSTVAGYPTDAYTNPNDFIQKLSSASGGSKTGASLLLKVTAGDKFNIRVNSWYKLNGVTPTGNTSPLTDIVNALINSVPGASGNKILQQQVAGTVLNPSVSNFLTGRDSNAITSRPKAYLNIILLDEQLKPVVTNDGKNSYFEQVGADNIFTTHNITGRSIRKSGYLYIYVSNETQNVNVFFDNLQVTQIRGPLLETTDYYPFGLTMSGISSKAFQSSSTDCGCSGNKKGFNGDEIQNEEFSDGSGLELYDFNARTYDQQIGRFIQIDPLAESQGQEVLTPYHFALNNPVTYSDPTGKCPWCIGAIIGGVGGFIYGAVKHGFKNGGWKKVLATTAAGAVGGATLGLGTGAIIGAGGAATMSTAGAAMAEGGVAILSGAASNLTDQGISMALGTQDKFDGADLAYSMTLAVPEMILSKAVTEPIGNSIKSQLSEAITDGAINTLSAGERGQIVKDVAKNLRKEIGGGITRKQSKIAADKIVNMMEKSEQETLRVGIKIVDNSVKVSSVIVDNVVNDTNKEIIKNQ